MAARRAEPVGLSPCGLPALGAADAKGDWRVAQLRFLACHAASLVPAERAKRRNTHAQPYGLSPRRKVALAARQARRACSDKQGAGRLTHSPHWGRANGQKAKFRPPAGESLAPLPYGERPKNGFIFGVA